MQERKEFYWKIENFIGGGTLRSPSISVGNPHHSNWYVQLIIRSNDFMDATTLDYTLCRTNGSFNGQCTCTMSIVFPNGKKVELGDSDSQTEFLIFKHCLNLGTLTLHCRLMFSDAPYEYFKSVEEISQKISSLYESKEFSDLTLYTNEKEFLLHKFLLRERAPALFEDLNLDTQFKDGRVKVDTISTPVLEALLQYLYSGTFDTIPEEYFIEFYKIIEKYKLEELSAEGFSMESVSSISTRMNSEQKIIYLNIDVNEELLSDKSKIFKYIHFDCATFLITNNQTKSLEIKCQCVSLLKKRILLSCDISLGEDEKSLKYFTNTKLAFESERVSTLFSMPIYEMAESEIVKLNIEVFDGEYKTYSVAYKPLIPLERLSFFRMGLLKHDISVLYDKTQSKNNCDVTLCFECDEVCHETVLFAHKAILAAWSPVFSSMFTHNMLEKDSNKVKIPDISISTGQRLMLFMYTCEITKSTYENDMELYIAADKYHIPSLLKQCEAFLTTHLTTNNACDILILADQHSNTNLLTEVQNYIGSNRSVIMGSKEWLSLADTNPRLVSQVLSSVSGALRWGHSE